MKYNVICNLYNKCDRIVTFILAIPHIIQVSYCGQSE